MDSQSSRFPLLNIRFFYNSAMQAKILRMSNDTESAIQVMQEGLKPSRSHSFAQADTIVRIFSIYNFGPTTSLSYFWVAYF